METKELRKEINQALKELGLKRKDYSLKIRESGYADTYIKCTIKNPYVNIVEVEKILYKYRDTDYDQRSLEILQGCNTFVIVQYEYGIFDEVSKDYIPEAERMINEVKRKCRNYEALCFHIDRYNVSLAKINNVLTLQITNLNVFVLGRNIYDAKELAKVLFKLYNYKEAIA